MALDRESGDLPGQSPALFEKQAGRYVLIREDQIVGVWDTRTQALEQGYERFLLEPFLVHQFVAEEKPIFLSRGFLRCQR